MDITVQIQREVQTCIDDFLGDGLQADSTAANQKVSLIEWRKASLLCTTEVPNFRKGVLKDIIFREYVD